MSYFSKQPGSRQNINNSIQYAGGQASLPTTTFNSETWQVRVAHNITGGGYFRIDSGNGGVTVATVADMFVPANAPPEYFSCSGGQCGAFISTSTSTGAVSVTEMA